MDAYVDVDTYVPRIDCVPL